VPRDRKCGFLWMCDSAKTGDEFAAHLSFQSSLSRERQTNFSIHNSNDSTPTKEARCFLDSINFKLITKKLN